jgi:hypothetical protein
VSPFVTAQRLARLVFEQALQCSQQGCGEIQEVGST